MDYFNDLDTIFPNLKMVVFLICDELWDVPAYYLEGNLKKMVVLSE